MSDADLQAAFSTNLIAPMALTRDAIPALRASSGVVINIGSTVARIAKANMAAYSSSKLAVEQATRSLAVELALRIGPVRVRDRVSVRGRQRGGAPRRSRGPWIPFWLGRWQNTEPWR
jgi:NADP-dependent 3-hydroxy acid dehydrogenase YdfG